VNCTIFESRLLSPWRRYARPVSCQFSVANRQVGADPARILELVRRRQVGEVFVEMITVTNHREDPLGDHAA
jgi:hypothetical protein